MLSLMAITALTLHTGLCELDMQHPKMPCTPAKNMNAYNSFLKKHIRDDFPTDLKKDNWKKFIKRIGTWDRPVQSFFPLSLKNNLTDVCSSGGKMYRGNLCISKKPFSFITVKIDIMTKTIKTVERLKNYVILACDRFGNKCLPDHFEANTKNIQPNTKKPNCNKSWRVSVYEEVFPWL